MAQKTHIVRRKALQALISSLPQVTLIEAAVGMGKSMFLDELSEQHRADDVHFVTFKLTPKESRAKFFVKSFIKTLEKQIPSSTLYFSKKNKMNGAFSLDDIYTIIEQLVECLELKITIIFDNFQFLQDDDLLNFIEELIYIENVRLVISSRNQIRLKFPHLKGSSELVLITDEQLKFDLEEMTDFFHNHCGLEFRPAALNQLWKKLGGWPGVSKVIADKHIRLEHPMHFGNEEFLEMYAGSDPDLTKYLDENYRDEQDDEMFHLFGCTALFSNKNKTLLDALSEDQTSKFLKFIQKQPLTQVKQSNRKIVIQYPGILEEYFSTYIKLKDDFDEQRCFLNVGEYYHEEELYLDYVDCLFKAKKFDKAANILSQNIEFAISEGNIKLVVEWFETIPHAIIQDDINLIFLDSWCKTFKCDWPKLKDNVKRIEQLTELQELEAQQIHAKTFVLQQFIALYSLEDELLIEHIAELEADQRELPLFYEAITQNIIIEAKLKTNYLENVQSNIQFATNIAESSKNKYAFFMTQLFDIVRTLKNGSVNEAYSKLWKLQLNEQVKDNYANYQITLLIEGIIDYSNSEIDLSYLRVTEVVHLSNSYLNKHIRDIAVDIYATILALKDIFDASSYVVETYSLPTSAKCGDYAILKTKIALLRMMLLCGDITEAKAHVERNQISFSDIQDCFTRNIFAKFLLTSQSYNNALELLTSSKKIRSNYMDENERSLLLAIAYDKMEDNYNAIMYLEKAIMATPIKSIQVFIEHHLDLIPLIQKYILQISATNDVANKEHIHKNYQNIVTSYNTLYPENIIEPVLVQSKQNDETEQSTDQHIDLIEPLSKKETEVLEMIVTGATNKAIAADLNVSINTVKWHVRHILEKFGVEKRTQVIAIYNQKLIKEAGIH